MAEKPKQTDHVGDRIRAHDENWKPPPPEPGVRVAMQCPECSLREFGNPDWKCPTHGKAVRQGNAPYFKQSTEAG